LRCHLIATSKDFNIKLTRNLFRVPSAVGGALPRKQTKAWKRFLKINFFLFRIKVRGGNSTTPCFSLCTGKFGFVCSSLQPLENDCSLRSQLAARVEDSLYDHRPHDSGSSSRITHVLLLIALYTPSPLLPFVYILPKTTVICHRHF